MKVEGLVADYDLTLGDLIGTIKTFFERIGPWTHRLIKKQMTRQLIDTMVMVIDGIKKQMTGTIVT
jgi:hypothetical protein